MELRRRRREGTRNKWRFDESIGGREIFRSVCVLIFNGGVKNFQIKIRLMSFAFHRLIICFKGN